MSYPCSMELDRQAPSKKPEHPQRSLRVTQSLLLRRIFWGALEVTLGQSHSQRTRDEMQAIREVHPRPRSKIIENYEQLAVELCMAEIAESTNPLEQLRTWVRRKVDEIETQLKGGKR